MWAADILKAVVKMTSKTTTTYLDLQFLKNSAVIEIMSPNFSGGGVKMLPERLW